MYSLFEHKGMRTLLGLVFIAAIAALLAYTHLTLRESKYMAGGFASINVSGEGEVFARPDIATFNFSVRVEADTAEASQEMSAEATNAIKSFLTDRGVEEKDIRTSGYNVYPRYDYVQQSCVRGQICPPGEQVLRGYETNENVTVKVREIDSAGELISGVGELGATNVSGLQFTIDDEDALKAEARGLAIEDAKEKAEKLADDLGVKLVRVSSFYEEGQGGYGGEFYARAETASFDGSDDALVAPNISVGENQIVSRVNITYEIR